MEIEEACDRLDSAMESVMYTMTALSNLYIQSKETGNSKRVVLEMKRIEEEFTSTYEAARRFLDTQKEQSTETSEILIVDMLDRLNISEQLDEYEERRYRRVVWTATPGHQYRHPRKVVWTGTTGHRCVRH